ncbi:MAG: hypothetical protein ACR2J8_05090 [Thermomicrobiales bacterium]
MWIVTRTHWPTLVNLDLVAHIRYQQISKADPRIRVMALALEQEFVLAEALNGEHAQNIVRQISEALNAGEQILDLTDAALDDA